MEFNAACVDGGVSGANVNVHQDWELLLRQFLRLELIGCPCLADQV